MTFKINPQHLHRITESIGRIQDNTTVYNLDSIPIILTDVENAKTVYNPDFDILEKAYLNSFGGVKANITYNNSTHHLIVINMEFVESFDLSDEELDGVIAHELGHLFNKYNFERVPNYLDVVNGSATREDMERIKKENANNNEIYADYFTKLTSTSDGLISSITKFVDSDLCTNAELFELRLLKLEEDTEYMGEIQNTLA